MINPLPEHSPRPLTLEHFVLEETAKSAVYLGDLAVDNFLPDQETTPADIKLNKCIGDFVVEQIAKQEEAALSVVPAEIEGIAQTWLLEQIQKKILNARYEAYFEQKQSQLENLLRGKKLTALSLDGSGYPLADGRSMTMDPDSPKEVSGTVISYDSSSSKFWIETHPDLPEFIYEVMVWDYDPYSKELAQVSEIRID